MSSEPIPVVLVEDRHRNGRQGDELDIVDRAHNGHMVCRVRNVDKNDLCSHGYNERKKYDIREPEFPGINVARVLVKSASHHTSDADGAADLERANR